MISKIKLCILCVLVYPYFGPSKYVFYYLYYWSRLMVVELSKDKDSKSKVRIKVLDINMYGSYTGKCLKQANCFCTDLNW
jgi:hypothetical protein